ncbi:hypothetical protein CC78DRAFT_621214 [Lojkania enalia]|uniref:DUF7918 domain-containing protein n=1 Tax=Lojkania enalia TaxID=147567 RepID=A0A9P4JYH4_9PLEO|nr:hypothetical protein CC78DRAFT_621214 [Didymosphaeria enalia]
MPTYRSINIELHSQFDVETIPEYCPRPQNYYTERSVYSRVPTLIDQEVSTISTYIPVLPGSQFWISYFISPPVPDEQHFFFKLFINNAHIVSWSCGKNDGWKGKTMFGLFEREEPEDGKKRFEKRVLRFTPPNKRDGEWEDIIDAFDQDAHLEIRVHRARGRRRVARETEDSTKTPHGSDGRGIELVNAGRAGCEHPKRFYKFALVDPIGQPFATFRYYYRTWDQLQELGLLEEDNDMSERSAGGVTLYDGMPDPEKRDGSSGKEGEGMETNEKNNDGKIAVLVRDHYVPTGAPDPGGEPLGKASGEQKEGDGGSGLENRARTYRLSVPPSLRLHPPVDTAKSLPSIPQKSDSLTSTAYRPHPAYPVEDWVARTPSPIKSIRDGISTPPLGGRGKFSGLSLMNVVSNVWKRRSTPSSEMSSDIASQIASRSRSVS